MDGVLSRIEDARWHSTPIDRAGSCCDRACAASVAVRPGGQRVVVASHRDAVGLGERNSEVVGEVGTDRKSTRLNSSHVEISYAVFCLKKKKPLLQAPHDVRCLWRALAGQLCL